MLQISYYFEDKQLEEVGLSLSNLIDILLRKHKIKVKKLRKLNIEFLDKHIESKYYKPDPLIGAIGTYITSLEKAKIIPDNKIEQQVALFEKTKSILEECNDQQRWEVNFDDFFKDIKALISIELPPPNNADLITFLEKKIDNLKKKPN